MFARLYGRFSGYLCGGLAIALAITSLGWYVSDKNLDACQAGRKADKAMYEKAQADALAEHLLAIRKKEKEYADKAKKADADYDALVRKYNDAVRVYVTSTQGKASGTIAPAYGGSTEGDNGPGEDTEFLAVREVVVPTGDLLICAENTARLMIARDWALGLNE
jgi:hypothetical protein